MKEARELSDSALERSQAMLQGLAWLRYKMSKPKLLSIFLEILRVSKSVIRQKRAPSLVGKIIEIKNLHISNLYIKKSMFSNFKGNNLRTL
jgi:hypothetical protein